MEMAVNKKNFEVEVEGKKLKLSVLRPNQKQRQEGQKVYNRSFRDAVESGAILRAKIESVMREQQLWDDEKEKSLKAINEEISSKELRLKSGGIKLSDAKEMAIDLRKLRVKMRDLNSKKISLDNNSAEAQADNAQFNFFVSSCTLFADTGKPYFKSYEEFLSKEDDPITGKASGELAYIIYNLDEGYEKKLTENQFLVKYKFCDSDLHLVDKQQRKIDSEGRLVNNDGRFINDQGEFVDRTGNRVDLDGNYVVEEQPFLDDDDKPIIVEVEKFSEPEKPPEPEKLPEPEKIETVTV